MDYLYPKNRLPMVIKLSPNYLLDFSVPKVMGIINITPDSFFEGSRANTIEQIKFKIDKMCADGVDILDIGANSSRPGVQQCSEEEEINRLSDFILLIKKIVAPIPISIDTTRQRIAENAIHQGASLVNDISAGEDDPKMLTWIATHKIPYIMMHKKGLPEKMQENTQYHNIVEEILTFFQNKLFFLHKNNHHEVMIDLGFGFSKTMEQNYQLLKQLSVFHYLKKPIVVGVSRKSMIYKLLESSPKNALNGSTAVHTLALQQGANLLRVHDVKEAVETIKIYRYYTST